LVELLVAIAVVAILVAFSLPAVQAAREAARRYVCANNLRQAGLAVLGCESAKKRLPVGAYAGRYDTYGMSWWVGILPFLEEDELFDKLDRSTPFHGLVAFNPNNAKLVDGYMIEAMRCPSSPLPPFQTVGAVEVLTPSYVGIAGAASDSDFTEKRESVCCLVPDGSLSAGGALLPNDDVKLEQIADGLSRTIMIGECSDYARGATGDLRRVDGGYPLGWIAGTKTAGTPPHYGTPSHPVFNVTTIRYELNMKDFTQPGIDNHHGPNNPLISAHPGGVYLAFLDGSVHFMDESLSLTLLKALATRDDGRVIAGLAD